MELRGPSSQRPVHRDRQRLVWLRPPGFRVCTAQLGQPLRGSAHTWPANAGPAGVRPLGVRSRRSGFIGDPWAFGGFGYRRSAPGVSVGDTVACPLRGTEYGRTQGNRRAPAVELMTCLSGSFGTLAELSMTPMAGVDILSGIESSDPPGPSGSAPTCPSGQTDPRPNCPTGLCGSCFGHLRGCRERELLGPLAGPAETDKPFAGGVGTDRKRLFGRGGASSRSLRGHLGPAPSRSFGAGWFGLGAL